MNEVIPDFNDSLVIDSSEIISDYLELGIDSILENSVLKELPIIKTIISIGKIGNSIRERKLMKNLVVFINEINSGNIDREKLNKYREDLKKDNKKAEKELSRVLLILDDNIDNEKNIMVGKLFKAYINSAINWNEFCELTEVVRRIFVQDIQLLSGIYHGGLKKSKLQQDMYRIDRINSLGITATSSKALYAPAKELDDNLYLAPNKIGKKFMRIIFDDNN